MDMFMWVLAGGILGWVGYAYLQYNEDRGMVISVIIGAFGGFVGGKLIAPMFSGAAAVPGAFNASAMIIAVAAAAGFIAVGNLVYKRFGY
jgi:uncharacterized membrane protein YeaQ/YmgE (transglycosylase-associated protein family)